MVVRFLVGVWAILLAACYDVPRPACGFACGPQRECPAGYVCNDFDGDNRCHPEGLLDVECEPAPRPGVEDPRPHVVASSLEVVDAIDPSLTFIALTISRPVQGIDTRTFRLVRDDGVELAVDRGVDQSIETRVTMRFAVFTLEVGRSYSVVLEGNVFDSEGYRLAPYHYMFTVVPDRPPQVFQRYPAQGQTGVSVAARCYVELDEQIIGLDPSDIELRRGATVVPAFAEIGVDFNGLSVQAEKQLLANTEYTLAMLPGFSDIGGNVFPGESWQFATGADFIPPSASTSPFDGEKSVPVDRTILIEFDEAVSPIDDTTIWLETSFDEITVAAELTYDPINFVAYLNPELQLSPSTSYRVRIDAEIKDAAGNVLGPVPFVFETGNDAVAPFIVSTTPEAESTGAPRTGPITMVFDEAVMPPGQTDVSVSVNNVLLAGTVSAVDARSWQFVPSTTLPATTAIRVELIVTDVYGFSRSYSYEFTTGA